MSNMSNQKDEEDECDSSIFVVENGSHSIRTGFAGANRPVSFKSIIGKLTLQERDTLQSAFIRRSNVKHSLPNDVLCIIDKYQSQRSQNGYYFGDDTVICRSVSHPIEDSMITNWNDIEHIWQYAMDELNVCSVETSLFMTGGSGPINVGRHKEKMAQIAFESMQVPRYYIACSATLTIYAAGRTTGLAVMCGYKSSVAVPVLEGWAYGNPEKQQNFGGKELTKYLHNLLNENSKYPISMQIAKHIKETLCFVEYETDDMEVLRNNIYTLPDGHNIELNADILSKCAETLLDPMIIGMEKELSLTEVIRRTICDRCVNLMHRSDLCGNIVLSGGNSLFNGLPQRLFAETKKIMSSNYYKPAIIAPSERLHSVWIGGSICSSLSTFADMWIRKDEYDEEGPNIVYKKCS